MVDRGSQYADLSALKGGIAYVEGDGSYLQIQSDLSQMTIQNIYAYFGGVFFAENGATVVMQDNLIARRIEVYEGAVAYLQSRGRLVARSKINISDNKMRTRAVVVALSGS